jgi:hypothetical protein
VNTTHNHPPRCCCAYPEPDARVDCPLCPDHGELAQLANDNPANNIPAVIVHRHNAIGGGALCEATDSPLTTGMGPSVNCPACVELLTFGSVGAQPIDVMPCCNQLAGRPHTDYCPGPGLPHDHRVYCSHIPTCPGYEVRTTTDEFPPITETNGNPFGTPVMNQRWHETGPDEAHETWRCSLDMCGQLPTNATPAQAAANVQAGYTNPPRGAQPPIDSWPTPDPNPLGMTHMPTHHTHSADPNGPHERTQCHPDRCGMWATQTTQPPSTTSAIPDQARQRYCGHGSGHSPHPNADDTVCGGYPPSRAGEPTPLATPTPGHCICGNDYDDTPPPRCSPVPERQDPPT